MKPRLIICLLSLIAFVHCGSGSVENTQDTESSDPSESGDTEATAVLFSTDFSSPGVLLSTPTAVDSLSLATEDNSALGSDAVLIADDAGTVYALHSAYSAFSSDNLTGLNPDSDFAASFQYSTGNGTNPTDAVIADGLAYLSLYNGDADTANVDADGNPADLLLMDLSSGEMTKRLSFFEFTEDDGDRHANASKMYSSGTDLFVLMQDLQSDFSVSAPGKLIDIDLTTNEVSIVVELEGRNPVDLAASQESECLFIANQAEFSNTTFNFDTSTAFGGIETVCNDGTQGLVDDAYLGGYVEKVAVSEDSGTLYAVVSTLNPDFSYTSVILSIAVADLASGSETPAFETFFEPGADIREIAIDPDNVLWVSHRNIVEGTGETSDPFVSLIDLDSGEVLSELGTDLPVTSIAFVE